MNRIAGKCKGLKQQNIVIAGGGAQIYGQFFKKLLPQCIINTDIAANSKAYYAVGVQRWQKRN